MVRNRIGYPTYVLQAVAFLAGALFFCLQAAVVKNAFLDASMFKQTIFIVKRAHPRGLRSARFGSLLPPLEN